MPLPLTVDELHTTTRAVRKRLDFTRAIDRQVILDCLAIAQQAPTASNMQNWHFVVVTDPVKRAALAAILGGHLKTGHTWTGQNRPKERALKAECVVARSCRDSKLRDGSQIAVFAEAMCRGDERHP
jgi:nitroreductase